MNAEAEHTRYVMLLSVVGFMLRQFEQIRELSTGWKHGEEGVRLLRINDIANAAVESRESAAVKESE